MHFSFKTIRKTVENILLKEKGSKFIGYAFPVGNDDQIKEMLQKIKAEHPKATHHCYAFRLGEAGQNYRANDDGEPSGSAGLPIYNQLLAHQVSNILLVVVRYYGGTKLGVSGLVKAYKDTAKSTLKNSDIILVDLETTVEIIFEFSHQNSIFTMLNKFKATILKFDTNETCILQARIKMSEKENISNQMSEMPIITYKFRS